LKTLTRAFSWHMVDGTTLGWQFVLIAEIFKMLELYPDPDTIVIRLEGAENEYEHQED
jgi:hypothetical protein